MCFVGGGWAGGWGGQTVEKGDMEATLTHAQDEMVPFFIFILSF